jgi:uracil-DNA glycosylase
MTDTPRDELDFGSDDENTDIVKKNKNILKKTTEPKKTPSKFIDEDDTSDDDDDEDNDEPIAANNEFNINCNKTFIFCKDKNIGINEHIKYIFPSVKNYSFKPWDKVFSDNKVKLNELIFNTEWFDFFENVSQKKYFSNIEKILSKCVSNKQTIVPYPDLMFSALNMLSPKKINVVILGQDPYFNVDKINNQIIPQAMGCSFSVCLGYPKPPSLKNIYQNLLKFGHITEIPDSGNLSAWVLQGCLLINSAFTTIHGKANAHQLTWTDFSKDLIKYISSVCENVVFMAWGKNAHTLCLNVDPNKHKIITSSHPSPYSFTATMSGSSYGFDNKNRKQVTYPSFNDTNHFGEANEFLESKKKNQILWNLFL